MFPLSRVKPDGAPESLGSRVACVLLLGLFVIGLTLAGGIVLGRPGETP